MVAVVVAVAVAAVVVAVVAAVAVVTAAAAARGGVEGGGRLLSLRHSLSPFPSSLLLSLLPSGASAPSPLLSK